MRKFMLSTKKQLSTLALGCALIASVALTLVNCTDPAPTKYTVSFNMNGGEPAIASKTVEAGKLLAKPATEPTKEGYTFIGWYKDKALTQAFNFDSEKITQNITLYAKWIEVHTVTFDTNGGTNVDPQSVESGKKASKPTNPSKEGYTFIGWYKDKALTQAFNFDSEKITQNITLYAKWIEVHTVTFDTNGGTNVDPQTVERGKKASRPTDPTQEGYTFVSWYSEEALATPFDFTATTITQDITLYAKWDINSYSVAFNSNGGSNVDPQTVERGKKASRPTDPTQEGYTFVSWYSEEALTTPFDFTANTITQDITLYAKWDINSYSVAFNSNGGTNVDPQTVENGKKASRPTDPTKEGHIFENWYRGAALATPFDFTANTITQNITLYAKWTPKTYTVTFNPNNGEAVTSQSVAYERVVPRPENPTKADSLFAGWYNDQVLTQAFDFTADKVTADITLYAKWVSEGTTVPHTVTFNLNGGSSTLTDKAVKAGESLTKPATDPTKEGHTFAGWFNDQALTQVFDFTANTITQDTILYAKWNPVTYTVTFNYNDGGTETDLQQQVNYGLNVEKPSPTREGYTLENWYSDEALTTPFDFTANTITQAITLYAKWTPKTYTVTFNYNDGGTETDLQQQVNYEQKVEKPNPTRTGYTLENWYSDEALTTPFDFTANTITQGITLYAKWIETYTVTFDANGGSNVDPQSVVSGKKASKPTKADSTFAGWYNDQALSQAFDFTADKVTADITLYAKWEHPTRVTIPDANFRKKLQALIPGAFEGEKLNTTSDEVTGLARLDVSFSNIGDLTGIHYFTALTVLNCDINQLSSLDVSTNTALTQLSCSRNQLSSLDVSTNTALTQLDCRSNQLAGLDVSTNTALTELDCSSNQLAGLDVSTNTALTQLDCRSNQLAGLDVSTNTALTALNCGGNQLAGLDVSTNTALTALDCSDNQLAGLDVSVNTALTTLDCSDNQLAGLDVSVNTALTTLYCRGNQLAGLDVSTNTALTELYCYSNQLSSLDVSTNTALTTLYCSGNQLSSLDVSTNTALTFLDCQQNQLTRLDMTGMRSVLYDGALSVHQAAGETNMIDTLKVHEALKDHAQISAVKTARGDKVTIETYSAATGSTTYTAVCSDYDPTETNEQDRCKDAP